MTTGKQNQAVPPPGNMALISTGQQCALDFVTDHWTPTHRAHIHADSDEGPTTFWNFLPLCANCNPPHREAGKWIALRDGDLVLRAHDYWTFNKVRQDVALKLCLYSLYERFKYDPLAQWESLRKLAQYAYLAVRAFEYYKATEECIQLLDFVRAQSQVPSEERASRSRLGTSGVRDALELKRAQDPPVHPERNLDRVLREATGALIAECYRIGEGDADAMGYARGHVRVLFEQARDPLFGRGPCTSHTYARLWVVVDVIRRAPWRSELLGDCDDDEVEDLLVRARFGGSESALRPHFVKKEWIAAGPLQPLSALPGRGDVVDILQGFRPLVASMGQHWRRPELRGDPRYFAEEGLLPIIREVRMEAETRSKAHRPLGEF
ncbi:MAG: HNH endonuclease [Planctomycetes bacterium]|nr:HNH endonuclease [Planctomycetota bacterium]